MNRAWKPLICAGVILAGGFLRLPYEAGISAELREAGLMAPKPAVAARERIGQTFSAVALGGLRTLVATFLNLRAFTAFTERKWDKVESTYDSIVELAPRTRYYWESGWHNLAYNAAADCFSDSSKPLYLRKDEWRTWIHKGRAFLERGIRNNPDDGVLYSDLGFMLTDANKFPAFRDLDQCFLDAAEAYQKAEESGRALDYVKRARLYALARVKSREAEALELARLLYRESRRNHTPSLLCILFALEARENPVASMGDRAVTLFGTPEKAYEALSNYWRRVRDRLPMTGVAQAMAELESRLHLPMEKRVSQKPLPPPPSPDDWFES